LKERKSLLTSAIVAVVEALRMNPDRYAIIYNSKYDNDVNLFDSSASTTAAAISSSYASPHSHSSTKLHQNYYYNEYYEGILEIANLFLKILSTQMADKAMVAMVKGE